MISLYIISFVGTLPSYILIIIITVQSASSLTVFGIVAIVLVFLGFILGLFLGFLPRIVILIGVIIFLVDRARTDRFDTLTIWFCVSWFGGMIPTLLFGSLWHAALKKYSYSAWLETFEEDWPDVTRYRNWWRLATFDKKVMSWVPKFFDSMNALSDWFEQWIGKMTMKIGGRKEIEVEEEVAKEERAMLEHDRAVIKKFML